MGDEAGVATVVWRRRRPFHPERLYAALEDLPCAAVRRRRRVWPAARPDPPLSWAAAGCPLCRGAPGPWLASLPAPALDQGPPAPRAHPARARASAPRSRRHPPQRLRTPRRTGRPYVPVPHERPPACRPMTPS
ncbi:GTP-binding protein [Streptomyces armeniacus]